MVTWGLHVTAMGFGIVAIFAILEDTTQTVRVASGFGALILSIRAWRSTRPGPAWPDERQRRSVLALWEFEAVLVLGNVVVGSEGYLHAIMLLFLFEPAAVFVAAIQDATSGPTAPHPD